MLIFLIIVLIWIVIGVVHWQYVVHPVLKKHFRYFVLSYLYSPYIMIKILYRIIHKKNTAV
jgi:hypothetical protein